MADVGWTFVLDEPVRILLADDDPILCEFAKVHLATPVASVESAPDGLAAWQRLSSEPFDLALIDIDMPGLDGFAVTERIRTDARLRHLPVVMLTGHDDILSIDRAYRCGATSFVSKPVNWRQLSYQLRYVLRTSRMEAEIREARDRAQEISTLKSNILSVMRHQFRTPLSDIIGLSDVIRKELLGGIPNPAYREHADYIHAAAHRLHEAFTTSSTMPSCRPASSLSSMRNTRSARSSKRRSTASWKRLPKPASSSLSSCPTRTSRSCATASA
jgi:CheY-like chemotaxis protein